MVYEFSSCGCANCNEWWLLRIKKKLDVTSAKVQILENSHLFLTIGSKLNKDVQRMVL